MVAAGNPVAAVTDAVGNLEDEAVYGVSGVTGPLRRATPT
jgi:hypothetical protein